MIERDTGRERLPGGPESAANAVPVVAPDAPAAPVGPAAIEPARPSGTSGVSGTPGTSGASGVSGTPGTSGTSGGAVVPAGGVNTLRAILLGGGSPRTPDDARLTAIERRLDTLSLQLAREPRAAGDPDGPGAPSAAPVQSPEEMARLAEIERRLAGHDARLDAASAATRGGDVTLDTLEALRQQVEALRTEHAALADQTASRLREADARCQLRQLRVRTARRQELQRLRRIVYAPAGVLSNTLTGAPGQPRNGVLAPASGLATEVATEAARPSETPPVWPVALGSPRPVAPATPTTPATLVVATSAPATMAPSGTLVATPADEKTRHAAMRRDRDMDGARHALSGSLAALMRSLATIAVVSARSARHDLRAAWEWLTRDRRAEGAGRERDTYRDPHRDPHRGPFSE